jgi:signal transduction histidine kinase
MDERRPRRIPRLPAIAIVIAAALVAVALVLSLLDVLPEQGPLPDRLVPMLVALGGVCVAALAIGRAATVAWLSTVIACGIAAIEVLGIVRGWQAFAGAAWWPWLAALGVSALVSATAVAGAYAATPRLSRGRIGLGVRGIVVAGLVALAFCAGWTILTAAAVAPVAGVVDLWPIRATSRIALALIVGFGFVGGIRDLNGPITRARDRLATSGPSDGRAGLAAFLRFLGDELVPTAAASRRHGAQEERARLAADLHALVLPDLRRAAAAADAAADVPEPLATGLRNLLGDVEGLMHARQSVVLEEFGLIAALEWLAERTEERSAVQVVIELGDGEGGSEGGGRTEGGAGIPKSVERAAFRIALLALDNVVRHADGSHATIRLASDNERLRLEVSDDGPGIEAAASRPDPGRGLVDMRSEASAAGAVLTIAASDGGTRIELRWPRPRGFAGSSVQS